MQHHFPVDLGSYGYRAGKLELKVPLAFGGLDYGPGPGLSERVGMPPKSVR